MIHLRLLGGADLRAADGRELRPVLSQPKRLALLAYLVLARPRGFHRRDRLHSLFWPELDEASARNALGQAIHFLRRELGEGVVANRGRAEVGIAAGTLSCDALGFEADLHAGRRAAAVDAYAGELLHGFHLAGAGDFDQWLERERRLLHRAAVEAAAELAEAAAAAGEPADACRWARRAAALDPLDEQRLRRLMALQADAGDRAGALQAYEAFSRRLHQALEAAPSAETRTLAESLRAGSPAAEAPPATIAVLPFLDLSPSPETYFADGITEELIAALAGVRGLRVTSRTSSFALRGRDLPLRAAAEELGVRTVLEGSIRCLDGRVRVVAQLIDARSDTHLWADTYERPLGDLLGIQREVSAQIARSLRGELTPAEERRIARPAGDPRAYTLYLQGRHALSQGSLEGWHQAVEHFRAAAEADPRSALAFAGLADAYLQPWTFAFEPPVPRAEALARGRVAALRALELDDELGEAHVGLAVTRWYARDWDGAERAFKRAILLSPSHADAHRRFGVCLGNRGRFEEAARELRRAQELDPLATALMVDRAVLELRARRYELAIAQLQRVLELDPGMPLALHYLSEAARYSGRYGLMAEAQVRLGRLSPERAAHLRAVAERDGMAAYAREWRSEAERIGAAPTVMAAVCARAGETERAWEWMERAVAEMDPILADTVWLHPGLDPLRADPRWAALLERLGIPAPPPIPEPTRF